jgi:hypothetical protein
MSGQRCTICGRPSVPGLIRGHGKCQHHWNVGVFGAEWADRVKAPAAAPHRPPANPRAGRQALTRPQRLLLAEAVADPRTEGVAIIDTWHQQQVGLALERRGLGRVEEPRVRQPARFVISAKGRETVLRFRSEVTP